MQGCFFILLLLPLCYSSIEDFQATNEWQEIKEGQKVPGGLHYRMNLETGKKEAKILDSDDGDQKKNIPVLSDKNEREEAIEEMSAERKKEIQDALDKLKANKDVENIKYLMEHFANSSSVEGKLTILEDLDYYMHQIDNARDFVALGGLTKLILPGLRSEEEKVVAKTAILLGSAAQANKPVQNAVVNAEVFNELLELLQKEGAKNLDELRRRLVFAISAITRENPNAMEHFKVLGGFKVLQKSLKNRVEDKDLLLKGLAFISDLTVGEETKSIQVAGQDWCNLLKTESLFAPKPDLDTVERLVHIVATLDPFCQGLVKTGFIQRWLKSARFQLWKDESADDFKVTIDSINKLLAKLKEEL